MNSDSETPIPLEDFHPHLVIVHGKGEAAAIRLRLDRQASHSGEPLSKLLAAWVKCKFPDDASYQEESWFAREIPVNGCYFAHTDFHCLCKLRRDESFVEFMRDKREQIDSDLFPFSSVIRAPWPQEPIPPPLVRERQPGKFYILDGQLRVIWHWYHNIENVRVLIYNGQLAL
ncbi:MAG: hypothetical protein WBY69_16380 [Candidatus Acidiferrales bacterium]